MFEIHAPKSQWSNLAIVPSLTLNVYESYDDAEYRFKPVNPGNYFFFLVPRLFILITFSCFCGSSLLLWIKIIAILL